MEDEAWITTTANHNGPQVYKIYKIHHRLPLPAFQEEQEDDDKEKTSLAVELVITLPPLYPLDESSIAQVDASVSVADNCLRRRKLVIDSLPSLLKSCRAVSKECAGQEAVFAILSRASEWANLEWKNIVLSDKSERIGNASDVVLRGIPGKSQELVLARKLIFSHHIIAKTKRKAIGDLARTYNLGGYAKIGWPGIIIIEGEEKDCDRFIDDIKMMRWQHLEVRGEEFEPDLCSQADELDQLRKFPNKMEELAEDQISYLADICKDVGLERLFKTFMKIYDEDKNQVHDNAVCSGQQSKALTKESFYGVLVHVDHMNNQKGYEKWIEKACKSVGCEHIVMRCHKNTNSACRPVIFICICGDESAVKQILKRWRTSRVDVDSKGVPCLERMMSVVIEGEIRDDLHHLKDIFQEFREQMLAINIKSCFEKAHELLYELGGSKWQDAFLNHIS